MPRAIPTRRHEPRDHGPARGTILLTPATAMTSRATFGRDATISGAAASGRDPHEHGDDRDDDEDDPDRDDEHRLAGTARGFW